MYAGIYYGQIPYAGNATYVPYTYTPASGALKNKDMWTNNDVKVLQSWINVTPKPTQFNKELRAPHPYLYDDPMIMYDSPMIFYDFKPDDNQTNNLNPTQWTEKYVN